MISARVQSLPSPICRNLITASEQTVRPDRFPYHYISPQSCPPFRCRNPASYSAVVDEGKGVCDSGEPEVRGMVRAPVAEAGWCSMHVELALYTPLAVVRDMVGRSLQEESGVWEAGCQGRTLLEVGDVASTAVWVWSETRQKALGMGMA